jgi:hypothetical protein
MAVWKKVIVSGSSANLAALSVDNLTSGSVVIGGGSGNLFVQAINGTGNIVATTGATGLSQSGSFSGSFQGSITGLINSASYALSASYAVNATTASYAVNATTASFAINATTASYALRANSASYADKATQTLNTLTLGTGLIGTSFNGSAAVTAAISGAAALTTNEIPKWTGTGFTDSNIVDTGTQIQIQAGASSGVSVAAGGVNVTGNSTFNNNLTVAGDLIVNGTASFINSTNTYLKDQFILIASGSSALTDAGIIAQYNAAGSGSAFFLEAASAGTYGRWALAYDLIGTSTAATADEYMVSTKINASAPGAAVPTWGGATNGVGNMWVTTAGDIFIYA